MLLFAFALDHMRGAAPVSRPIWTADHG
jgi:hypothetical protein